MERLGTVAIVGVGLIGGSIGLALRSRGLAARVVGLGRSEAGLDEALRVGAIDEATARPERAFAEAEVAVICTPVTRVAEDACTAARLGPPDLLVTDAGSTKARIVAAVEADSQARSAFVAAHPIAGSEKKGARHASADLFDGRACVLTPTTRTPADRLDRARAFWSGLGCRLAEMEPEAHDAALAWTSHLPHAVAAALAAAVPADLLPLAAGAYRDGTRVAGSDPALWAGILLENRRPALAALDGFGRELAAFGRLLEAGDADGLAAWWARARDNRGRFDVEPGGAPAPEGGQP